MGKIEKIRDDLYIKKGWDGYRVVFPIKKDPSNPKWKDNVHWNNLLYGGHWSRPLKAILFLIALYLFVQGYLHDTRICREFVENIGTTCAQYNSVQLHRNDSFDAIYPGLRDFNSTQFKESLNLTTEK